jgi:hypothetical protein
MTRSDRPQEVHMVFFYRSGWYVQSLLADARTPLRRKFNFKDPEKIREIARRGQALETEDARQELEHQIDNGRGGCILHLTPEEYGKLR